ncbi:DUF2059 domain-containing protein [Arcticibacter eurypsychrophilus]|uniref:DUF2059 domain-containing protein n=1 Tax=Arcticibacter eurypsychrophilus TaxID=1434752 RepID=UPI00084D2B14|nr:DUF2059 domain-containing protein [Arcticibacter eurypsychrophilus]
MKKTILLAILLGSLSFSSFAQASNEKVVELFQIMKSDKMMNGMMDNMMAIMGQQGGMLKNNEDNKAFTEYMNYVTQEGKLLMKKIMNEDMVTLYSKYFTNDEIQYYIDFYATPAGKKMLELTPTIQKEFMTSFMANDMPSFQAKLKVKLEEMHKKYPASNEPTVKNK